MSEDSTQQDPIVLFNGGEIIPHWMAVTYTTRYGELDEILYVSFHSTEEGAKNGRKDFLTEIDGDKISPHAVSIIGDAVTQHLAKAERERIARRNERLALLAQTKSELAVLL